MPKWFGERPGKKPGDPETPEGEEDVKVEDDIEEEEVEEEVEEEAVSFFNFCQTMPMKYLFYYNAFIYTYLWWSSLTEHIFYVKNDMYSAHW